jgi:DNA-binding response OmpR family regulator
MVPLDSRLEAAEAHTIVSVARPAVLIVDDDEGIRRELYDYLSDCEISVSTASNGREMDFVLARERIDVVLLDVMMS